LEFNSRKEEISNMDNRNELKRQYKQMKKEAGVYQIKNTSNQKVLIESTLDLKTMNGKLMQLRWGGHQNKQLQEEWNKFGEDTFIMEVLEVLDEPSEGFFDKEDELKKLKAKWLEKLQPYGDRGYHR
jgi:hypothetical protein